jgi:hypothetical protein
MAIRNGPATAVAFETGRSFAGPRSPSGAAGPRPAPIVPAIDHKPGGAQMTDGNMEAIQSDWSVWTADGTELGTIIAVEPTELRVKKNGLLGGEVTIPRDAVDEVETGRVEITLTKKEATRGN